MRILTSRAIATAAAAAIALSTVGLATASAHGPDYGYAPQAGYDNGDAAAAAAMLAIFGTMAALIAANQHRDHVYHGPVYGGPVHGPYGRQWSEWRHHHHR